MDALSILTAIAHAALLARMWRGHLFSAWPWFTAYLVLNLARGFALAGAAAYSAGNRGSLVYGLTWMISEPVILVMWVLMARELYLRVCDRYPGIGSFAWWFLLGAISIAVIVAGFTRVDWFAINWTAPAMSLTFFSRRIIATSALSCWCPHGYSSLASRSLDSHSI